MGPRAGTMPAMAGDRRFFGRKGATSMMRLTCILAILLWVAPAGTTQLRAASQNENQKADSAEKQRQVFQAKAQVELRDLDRKIDDLKARLRTEKDVDQKQINRQMNDLERKRMAAQRDLVKLENSSQAAWQDMKAGLESAMHDLESAYDQAASHFK